MNPRAVHPGAWWLWAVALAAVALRTKNPLLLLLIAAVAWVVVVSRRVDAPWARSFGSFVRLGVFVVIMRLVFQIVFAPRIPGRTLFALPGMELPDWLSGVTVGGPVTAESLLGGLYDGLQLAVLLVCVGAANSLASPYRLLRCLPTVLYEAGVAVTVALSFAPAASTSAAQIRDARRLRGRPHRGLAGLRGMAIPVLEGALERSLHLAASMDARGYGRRAVVAVARRRITTVVLGAGMLAVVVGIYALLAAGAPSFLGLPALVFGSAALVGSMALGGVRANRTRYRPDPWRGAEWLTVACGAVALVGVVAAARWGIAGLAPGTDPIETPVLPLLPTLAVLLALVPAFATPEPTP